MRIRISNFLYFILGLIGFKAMPAVAAQDVFMCIEGVAGETESPDHPGCIDVISWSWGAAIDGNPRDGSGVAKVDDVSVVKFWDKATPDLMRSLSAGTTYPKVEIFLNETCDACGPDTTYSYYTIKMKDVYITSLSLGGLASGDDRPTETLSLNFGEVEWCYTYESEGKFDPPDCGLWVIDPPPP